MVGGEDVGRPEKSPRAATYLRSRAGEGDIDTIRVTWFAMVRPAGVWTTLKRGEIKMRSIDVTVVAAALLVSALSSAALAQEEVDYARIATAAWFDYGSDLNYSSRILEDYVNKNISDAEAIQSLMAVYVMAGRTAANLANLEPPAEFSNFHNYTFSAVENFRLYLWNLAKFIETRYTVYGQDAMNYFNRSLEYREKALEESVLLL